MEPIGRIQMRTRRTLRGHLSKIYAMHWGAESRCAHCFSFFLFHFRWCMFLFYVKMKDAKKAACDTTLAKAAAEVETVGRFQFATRRTLRGHLSKIYSMHWASDSR